MGFSNALPAFDHRELLSRYSDAPSTSSKSILDLLEETEERISLWKLNKWEFRISSLVSGKDKETYLLQLDVLKAFFLERSKVLERTKRDLQQISRLGGVSIEQVRHKDQLWLQDTIAKLRWSGEVNKAKALRDAFTRLEIMGGRDYRILERLAAIYGLGMLNSFESAFTNMIVEDKETGRKTVQRENSFTQLLTKLLQNYPYVRLVHDFLGFNVSSGYRSSLRELLAAAVEERHSVETHVREKLIANDWRQRVILFDFLDSSSLIASNDTIYGLPDFVYITGPHFYLITVASENFWLRSRQLPHKVQMEGIGRRGSFVLGIPLQEVKIKNILLPPKYLDRSSIARLLQEVFGLSTSSISSRFPWFNSYTKELDEKDVDFCEMLKKNVSEEWLTL